MNIEKIREEFEAWARKMSMDLEYRNIPGVGQFYECPRTLLALEAWQASRANMMIDLPGPAAFIHEDDNCLFDPWVSLRMDASCNPRPLLQRQRVIFAIEAAGLKVKP